MAIVLASTSPYRRELLHRLRLPFEVVAPAVDEARLPGEAPLALALRLAEAKAIEVIAEVADGPAQGAGQLPKISSVRNRFPAVLPGVCGGIKVAIHHMRAQVDDSEAESSRGCRMIDAPHEMPAEETIGCIDL